MNDLSFLSNYKNLRQKFYPAPPVVNIAAKPKQEEPKQEKPPIKVKPKKPLRRALIEASAKSAVKNIEKIIYAHEQTQTSYDLSKTSMNRARAIVKEVAREMEVSVMDIISTRRCRDYVMARQYIMWRLKRETTWSLPRIGQFLGNRDHTTILHGIRKWEERMKESNDALS